MPYRWNQLFQIGFFYLVLDIKVPCMFFLGLITHFFVVLNNPFLDFPGGAVVKNPPANAGGHGINP